jgi:APA family basic amino acid/polyamine antiporter
VPLTRFSRVLVRKRIQTLEAAVGAKGRGLKRALGAVDLLALGIGAIVGAGIFLTVGTAAAGEGTVRPGAGPAIVLSFLLTGVACSFSALCYAEMAAMIPIAGSAYTYAYATLGEIFGWIIGWDLLIEYAAGNVAVAISWSGYFQELLADGAILVISHPLRLPAWLAHGFRHAPAEVLATAPRIGGLSLVFNLPAAAIVLLLTWLLVIGVKQAQGFSFAPTQRTGAQGAPSRR